MMYRRNKAMSRSPAIEKMVTEALEKSRSKKNLRVVITVPWDKFIFSTRDGRPYMPPSLQKGLAKLPPNMKDGVTLSVRHSNDPRAGHFSRASVELVSPVASAIIAHETLHFVQHVGQMLLQLGQGHGSELKVDYFPLGGGKWGVAKSGGGRGWRPYDTQEYGMPKKRSLTHHYRPADGAAHGEEQSEHGLRDIEFMSNALSIALFANISPDLSPEQLAEKVHGTVHTFYPKTIAKFTPQRLKDFYTAVWGFAVQRLTEEGAPASRYPTTPPASLWPILSGKISPTRERAGKGMVEEFDRRQERKRRRASAPPVSPPPARPARPARPAARASGLTYKMDSSLGPRAFFIFDNGKPTGKYFFVEEKARAYCERMSA